MGQSQKCLCGKPQSLKKKNVLLWRFDSGIQSEEGTFFSCPLKVPLSQPLWHVFGAKSFYNSSRTDSSSVCYEASSFSWQINSNEVPVLCWTKALTLEVRSWDTEATRSTTRGGPNCLVKRLRWTIKETIDLERSLFETQNSSTCFWMRTNSRVALEAALALIQDKQFRGLPSRL